LLSRTDARGITTSYSYDPLNRIKIKTYFDGTPGITYGYDAGQYALGRLTSVTNENSTTNFTSFDVFGHVLASNQVTAGQTYNFAYAYNLAGSLVSETYPSGRVVTTRYDGADRVSAVSGTFSEQPTPYVSGVTYAAHGAPSFFLYGNQVARTQAYNSRLQPDCYSDTAQNSPANYVWAVCPSWGGTNNNGNLQNETAYVGGTGPLNSLAQSNRSYSYDAVNRLSSASDSGGWSRAFCYDQNGNMWVTGSSGVPLAGNTPQQVGGPCPSSTTPYNSNNQIGGANYDAAGNQTVVNGDTLAYDAENRVALAMESPSLGGGVENYLYDGDGRRTGKWASSNATVYVYDAFGELAAEYSTATNAPPCSTCYLSSDHLGSTRLVTDQSGNIVARHDYLPFGEETAVNTADNVYQKFTGKERDPETGLDYFGARYYGSSLGRFTSPDWSEKVEPVPYAELENPQTLNLYAYARNNPLSHADLDGHCTADGEDHGWLWCAAHAAGLVQTQKEQVDYARQSLSQMQGFTIGGQSPQDFAKNATNQQAIQGLRAADSYIAGQALSPCGPGISCGVIVPPGVASAEAGAVEAAEAEAVEVGAQSDFINITKNGSVANIRTNVTAADFGKNLEANGFTKGTASDGTPIYTKGNTQYTVYPRSTSTGEITAQVKVNGAVVQKIRLQ
jgi:RHS repeat-associated protein